MSLPWAKADLCGHLQKQGHTDTKWRRRFCVLKGPRLFILRTAAAPQPLAVLDLPGAAITASSTPLYPEDSSTNSPADSSDVLWVLRIQIQQEAAQGSSRCSLNNSSSKTVKIKIAAQTRELQELWRDALQAAADEPAAEDSIQLQLEGAIPGRRSSAAHTGSPYSAPMPLPRPPTAAEAAAAAEGAGLVASEHRRARSSVGRLTANTQQVVSFASRPARRSSAAGQPRSSLLESPAAAAASVSDADADADTEQEESLPGQQQQQQHQGRGRVLVREQVQPERRRRRSSSTSKSAAVLRGTAAGSARPLQQQLLQAPLQQQPARISQRQGVLLVQQPAQRSALSELQAAALPRASLLLQQQPGRVSAGPQSRGTTPGHRTSLLQGMPERVSVSLTEGLRPQRVRSQSLQHPPAGGRLSLLPQQQQQQGRASRVQQHAGVVARHSHTTGRAHGEPDLSGMLPQKMTQLQFMAARLSQAGAQAIPSRVSGVGGSRGYGGSNMGAGTIGSKRASLTAAAAAAANKQHKEKGRGRHQEGDAFHSSNCSDSDTASSSKGADYSSSSSSDASEGSAGDSGSSDGSSGRSPGKPRHVRAAPHTWGLGQLCCWLVAPGTRAGTDSDSSSYDSDSTMHSWRDGQDSPQRHDGSSSDGSGSDNSSSAVGAAGTRHHHRRSDVGRRQQQQQQQQSSWASGAKPDGWQLTPPQQQQFSSINNSRRLSADSASISLRPRVSAAAAAGIGMGVAAAAVHRMSAPGSTPPATSAAAAGRVQLRCTMSQLPAEAVGSVKACSRSSSSSSSSTNGGKAGPLLPSSSCGRAQG